MTQPQPSRLGRIIAVLIVGILIGTGIGIAAGPSVTGTPPGRPQTTVTATGTTTLTAPPVTTTAFTTTTLTAPSVITTITTTATTTTTTTVTPTPTPGRPLSAIGIPDPNLEAAARHALNKPTGDITAEDMARLTTLEASGLGIQILEGLQHAVNLRKLGLNYNKLRNIDLLPKLAGLEYLGLSGHGNQLRLHLARLAGLTSLRYLDLSNNQIREEDFTPLVGLTSLKKIGVSHNGLTDITPLAGLTRLEAVALIGNQITDISPLVANPGLGAGDTVDLSGNPLSETALNIHIPALRARGVRVIFT